ncbi:hypothetical protein D0Y65_043261 [Glycine soja]|nr:hypothetical protein D0Y65_043261 [Glycine soja]
MPAGPHGEPQNKDGAKNTPTTGSGDGEQGKVRGREAGEYFPPQPRVGSMPTPSPLAPNTFQKTPMKDIPFSSNVIIEWSCPTYGLERMLPRCIGTQASSLLLTYLQCQMCICHQSNKDIFVSIRFPPPPIILPSHEELRILPVVHVAPFHGTFCQLPPMQFAHVLVVPDFAVPEVDPIVEPPLVQRRNVRDDILEFFDATSQRNLKSYWVCSSEGVTQKIALSWYLLLAVVILDCIMSRSDGGSK